MTIFWRGWFMEPDNFVMEITETRHYLMHEEVN
jgi:hypothetical protein